MNWIDISIIVLLGISVLYSLLRGFIKELFSLAAIIIGVFVASQFYQHLSNYLFRFIRNSIVTDIIGFVIIFIVIAILVSFIGRFVRRLLRKGKALTFIDRLAGGMLGILKGVLILSLILIPINLFPSLGSEMMLKSKLLPYLIVISRELTKLSFTDIEKKLGGNPILKEEVKKKLSHGMDSVKKTFLDKKEWIKKREKEVRTLTGEDISENDKAKLDKLLKDNL